MTKKPVMIRDDMPEIELTPQVQSPPQRPVQPPSERELMLPPKARTDKLRIPRDRFPNIPFLPRSPPRDWKRDPNPLPRPPRGDPRPFPLPRPRPIPPRGEPRPFPRRPIPRIPLKPKKKPFQAGKKPRRPFKMGVPRKERIRLLKEKAAAEARKRPSSVVKRRR